MNKTVKETVIELNKFEKMQKDMKDWCSKCPADLSTCEECNKEFAKWLNNPINQEDYKYLVSL